MHEKCEKMQVSFLHLHFSCICDMHVFLHCVLHVHLFFCIFDSLFLQYMVHFSRLQCSRISSQGANTRIIMG